MTIRSDLKRAAEAVMGMNYPWEHTIRDGRLGKTSTEYARLAHPSNVLGLIAENERLKAECEGLRVALTSSSEFLMHDAKVRRMLDGAGRISPMFPLRRLVMEQIDVALSKGERS